MEYIRCKQTLLPIRVAFTVSVSDSKSVIEATQYSTVLWGGVGNVIIPIWKRFPTKRTKSRSLGLLKDFDPDYIINLTSFSLPKEIVENYSKRILPKSRFLIRDKKGTRFGAGLTILPLIQHVWDTETRSITGKSRALLLKNIERSRYKSYWSVVFGSYSKLFDFASKFSSGLKAKELKASFANLKKVKIEDVITPIEFTGYKLTKLGRGGGFSTHIIFIGNPTNRLDLVEFWNIRASGGKVLFVPTTHFKQFGDAISSMVDKGDYPINERVQNQADLQKGPSVKEPQFVHVCDWIKRELGHNLSRRSWIPSWGARRRRVSQDITPCSYVDSEKTDNLLFDGESLAPLELIKPSFFREEKLYERFSRGKQDRFYWINQIELSDNYKNDYFFKLPQDEKLTELISRSFILGSPDKVRLNESGIVYYNNDFLGQINIYPPRVEEVIGEMFGKRNLKISPSPAGIFAKRIMEHLGGLRGCRVFKIRGVRDALIQLSNQEPRFGKTFGDLKGIVGNRTKDDFGGPNWDDPIYKGLVLYYKQLAPLTPVIAIDHLFKKNVFRVGLRFTCQKCGKEDWYHLTEFDINFTCRYCFQNQHIGSLEGRAKREWHYKSDGLFTIPNVGEGSLSVILALWRLDHLVRGGSFKYLSSQNVLEIKDCEIDFVAVFTDHFQMGSVLVLGEARNFIDFTRKNVSKLMEVGSRFSPKPHLCFATLKDKFSDKEIEELKRVVKHGFGLIPLTRLDLDPYNLYDRFDSLKNKHAVTLEDFSFNLCALNLDLTEDKTYDLIHFKEKEMHERFMRLMKEREKKKKQAGKKQP